MSRIVEVALLMLIFNVNHVVVRAFFYFFDKARMKNTDWEKDGTKWVILHYLLAVPAVLDMFFEETVDYFECKRRGKIHCIIDKMVEKIDEAERHNRGLEGKVAAERNKELLEDLKSDIEWLRIYIDRDECINSRKSDE